MNSIQLLKAHGLLPNVELRDLRRVSANAAVGFQDMTSRAICGHPELADSELADTEPDRLAEFLGIRDCAEYANDEAGAIEHGRSIRMMHRGMQAIGRGSWPACNPTLYPNFNSVQYHVDWDSFPSHYQRTVTEDEIRSLTTGSPWWGWSFDEGMDRFRGKTVLQVCLLVGVEETFRLTGCPHIYNDDLSTNFGIHIKSRVIPGSTIGVGWFPDGTCSDHVEFHIDSSWNPSSIHPRIGLFGHECGHCNKLPHTFSGQDRHKGVMSYRSKYPYEGFSRGGNPWTLPEDPSWRQLKAQYGGDPAPEKPGTPPPPSGNAPVLEGTFRGELASDGEYSVRGEVTIDFAQSSDEYTYVIQRTIKDHFEFVEKVSN